MKCIKRFFLFSGKLEKKKRDSEINTEHFTDMRTDPQICS